MTKEQYQSRMLELIEMKFSCSEDMRFKYEMKIEELYKRYARNFRRVTVEVEFNVEQCNLLIEGLRFIDENPAAQFNRVMSDDEEEVFAHAARKLIAGLRKARAVDEDEED